ncbi:MAG: hypothetical protein A3A80_00695 [Candidatus Terrybacteria bacterium RIFCSPLOWO2_01_FULL_44_24]|uniref:DEAD/DEAH box helicase n=1 Tax=Candidatus Terrybacteria bacterium RIFCSPHIGHO2_01_FULL_43_35 TaxID=1802361 RepID=A0A1G2PCN9_9BACT|nr:MAG: hypothetical protein A2828_02700 [Candidatus Terrybacteria bacterium RIFCSPHIGHO2_01_FULL_43_35]OHA49509.1 MAG: hypothetical protein A3B75_00025 [Candidatus Terrybacteria bacterium RIFCSPHIGHO2_02_FULL_43_14]OHA51443.1 MAG: hypothetical protein A3A80_00695 [Candidatus Terrybacteria bacterium RIFCSPLOWO2_01_FULL_44_24]
MQNSAQQVNSGFYGLGIAPSLLDILAKLGYRTPTPIQRQAIPIAMQGKDVVGIAQTGTGKTLAFGIPMIQLLAHTKGRGLVLLPTRELALQVDEQLRKVGHSIGLRTAVLIGGLSIQAQIQAIAKNPHVIIATPGRLNDHLNQKTVNLSKVNILVLDEADRMLDMGFLPQIQKILHFVPKERQTMLFSATISAEVMRIATANMKLPLRVEVSPSGTTVESVAQEIFVLRKEAKNRLLEKILSEYQGSVLVFTRTKFGAKRVTKAVRDMGHSVAEIHSNRSLAQRRDALGGFKTGKYRVLVATDIAARGIDVIGIELVINYDFPMHPEDYVHRIGRTGRAGAEGRAISFVLPEEQRNMRGIERLIRKNLRISPLPELPPQRISDPLAHAQPRQQYRYPYGQARQPRSFRPRNHRGRRRG